MTTRPRRPAVGAVLLAVLLGVLTVPFSLTHAAGTAADGAPPAEPVPAEPARVTAAPQPAGPPMTSSPASRHAAVTCLGDLADPARPPVLLVPGTGLSAEENWAPTYRPALLTHGFAVCQVSLPHFGTRDAQVSIEYVATAIRDVHRTARRPVSVVGLSQGGLLPRAALKTWPSLAADVDDVIGLAGVYEAGSAGVAERCRTSCAPALQQLRPGAGLLTALHRRRLPVGPSYTNVGTAFDLTVTPQPAANQQRGSRSVMVQDVCPGRGEGTNAHVDLVGDAVAFALVLDTLTARGTGAADRVPVETCDQGYYPEFDEARWTGLADDIGTRLEARVTAEPPVRCYLQPACTDARARGRLLSGASARRVGPRTVVWRARAHGPGFVRLHVPGRTVVRRVAPGAVVVRLRVPRSRTVLTASSRLPSFNAWAVESRHRVRGHR